MTVPSFSAFIVCDLETAGLEAATDPDVVVWGGTLTTEHGTTWYSDLPSLWEAYKKSKRVIVFHNGKFDERVLSLRGYKVPEWHDTMVMAYQFEPGAPSQGVEAVARRLKIREGKLKLPKDWSWNNPDQELLVRYAKQDGLVQFEILKRLLAKFDSQTWEFYLRVDAPYIQLALGMEDVGLYVAPKARDTLIEHLDDVLRTNLVTMLNTRLLVPAVVQWDGDKYVPSESAVVNYKRGKYTKNGVTKYAHCRLEELNPNSAGHIGWVMQEVFSWEPTEFTEKTQEPSITNETMGAFNADFTVALVEWLLASKVRGTFLKAFVTASDSNGYVHGKFNTCRTRSGRLSSSDPNLQNIPTRSELGHKVRELFTPPPGQLMFGGDLSNIELRVLAYLLETMVGDSQLADTFRRGEDVHWANAKMFGFIALATDLIQRAGLTLTDQLLKDVARNAFAKTAVYATLYGAGAAKVEVGSARGLPFKLPSGTGKLVLDTMDQSMPSLGELKELVWSEARRDGGIVTTVHGRRLPVRELMSRDKGVRAAGERKAFNYKLQGTAADIMKMLHLEVASYVTEMDAVIAAAVHDELIGYSWAPLDKATEMVDTLSHHFSTSDLLGPVPIGATFSIGPSWAAIH